MIIGVGTDLISIARIERAIKRHEGFTRRVLSSGELALNLDTRGIAGRWAAKEAVYKASPIPLHFNEIEVLPSESGAPIVTILSKTWPGHKVWVSIAHEAEHAIAMAVIEHY